MRSVPNSSFSFQSRPMSLFFPRGCVATLCVGVLGFAAHANPIDFDILSGSSWKSSDTFVSGWETLGFDDGAWAQAYAPYPKSIPPQAQDLISGTSAEFMWHYPSGTPTGTDGPISAFFRYDVNLSLSSSDLPLLGQALLAVDDDYELYVNGLLAAENKDSGNADQVDFVDFTSKLRNGKNVFALHAVDGGWNDPRDRLNEWVLFDGHIQSTPPPIPEPGSMALMGAGLLGLLALVRKRRE